MIFKQRMNDKTKERYVPMSTIPARNAAERILLIGLFALGLWAGGSMPVRAQCPRTYPNYAAFAWA